jgi:hypothetical protein
VSGEHGQKFPGKFSESDCQVGVGDALHGPVAATDNEAGFLPECSARVNVPPARARKHATKLGHRTAAQQCVDSSEEPNRKDEPATPKIPCDFTRCAKYASTDRVSDADSKTKANAEDAQQVTAAIARANLKEAMQRMLGIIPGNRLLQDLVNVGHWGGRIA